VQHSKNKQRKTTGQTAGPNLCERNAKNSIWDKSQSQRNKNWKWQIALGGLFRRVFPAFQSGSVDRKNDSPKWAQSEQQIQTSSVIHLWRQRQQCRTYSKSNSRLNWANTQQNRAKTENWKPKTTRIHRKIIKRNSSTKTNSQRERGTHLNRFPNQSRITSPAPKPQIHTYPPCNPIYPNFSPLTHKCKI